MKIMIDARFYGLEHAGLGRYTLNLVEQLKKLDEKNNYYILLKKDYFNRLKFPKNWIKIKADFPHYGIVEQFSMRSIINKFSPDIFHSLNANAPYFVKSKLIITVHDITQLSVDSRATTKPIPIYLFKLMGYKTLFKKTTRMAKKLIVPTKTIKNDLVDFYKIDSKKISAISEGVDNLGVGNKNTKYILEKYDLNNKKYILYVGSVYPHKNIERVIESIKYLNETRSEKIFFVIGCARNKFSRRIEKIVKDRKASDFVKFLGFVPDEFLPTLYNSSQAFVFPSLKEGFGLPGLEALSAGTILLASQTPVFKEVYEKNAIYFNPFDFTSISEAIEESLSLSVSLRKAKIDAGKKFVKKYSWKKMAKETLQIYNKVDKY